MDLLNFHAAILCLSGTHHVIVMMLMDRSANVEVNWSTPRAQVLRCQQAKHHTDPTNIWYCCHSLQSNELWTFVNHQVSYICFLTYDSACVRSLLL